MIEFGLPVQEIWWIEDYMQEEGRVVWKGRDRWDEVVSIIIVKLTTKEITGKEKRQSRPSILRNNVPEDTWACKYMCNIIE